MSIKRIIFGGIFKVTWDLESFKIQFLVAQHVLVFASLFLSKVNAFSIGSVSFFFFALAIHS